ncbi:TIGR02594 family protein [Hansschlegelia zhihuaiae]|uniref:TIGR02594 family protein n=1 Tax=Hansschlegelia zhihuaiae TaxID=405005 RepID=A0A4Q0MN70_9HYPH|nr:TIGR02594 family protein [Hansschlegelia zhihuaiae]RXF75063.1 TIGR02594 family protein [Hansschlegelia zhihuaiae]
MTEAPWLAAARKDLGLKEIVGSRHEPRVVAFFAESGAAWVKDDETAWCAAFVGAKLAEIGISGTGKLNARSYLDWGAALTKPAPGAIVVFKRGSSSWEGHVAFYLGETATTIRVLGGNQANAVTEAAYAKSSLLGYRWPAGFALPIGGPAKPAAAPGPTLQLGSKGEAVKSLQSGLNALGAKPALVVDGDFGPMTRSAVIAFQKGRQLAPDAIVGPKTWTAFDTAIAQLG